MAAHKWAKEISAWAKGEEIQGRTNGDRGTWIYLNNPNWGLDYWEFRIKPAEPERVYPTTQMNEDFLRGCWHQALFKVKAEGCETYLVCAEIINAGLRHSIDAGQVVTREEFDKALSHREQRDCLVIDAAIAYVRGKLGCLNTNMHIDYLRIIKKIE